MRRWGCLVLGCLLAAELHAVGLAQLPKDAVVVDAGSAKPDAARMAVDAGAIAAKALAGDAEGAFALLGAIDEPVRFELTAARAIDGVLAAPRAGADAFLHKLEAVPSRVFTRNDESAADWFQPAIDVAGKARAARATLLRHALRDELLARISADAKSALAVPEAQASAFADAIALAPEGVVAQLVNESAKSSAAALPSAAYVAIAKRSRDARAWELALARAEPVDVLPLFALARSQLSAKDAQRWLDAAAKHPAYASAAAMARASYPAASLDDPVTRFEAAAKLAREPDALATIDRLAADPKSSSTRLASLALALRLIDSDAARERLHALANDARLPAHVRKELQR